MKAFLKKIANYFGYDIMHLPTDPLVRQQMDLLRAYEINMIFDIGANSGQFGSKMRSQGYDGRIISFEPLKSAYQNLYELAEKDSRWQAINYALGDYDGEAAINVSQNSYSSSILEILPSHIASTHDSVYVGTETIKIYKIDSIIDQYYDSESRLFIKIDTQGYERAVFEGCKNSMDNILGFQMELSLVPLYESETLALEMIELMRRHGYFLKLIESGHRNYETGEILQVEGYFYRK
jgi:FkbM family methyltransferase